MLAQVGEFSFLLGAAGLSLGLLSENEFQLVVSVTVLSLIISPVWLVTARRLLRIALTGANSANQAIQELKEGGLQAVWLAAKSRTMPSPLAQRILGRPTQKPFPQAPRNDPDDTPDKD